jgi:hypothetical protein
MLKKLILILVILFFNYHSYAQRVSPMQLLKIYDIWSAHTDYLPSIKSTGVYIQSVDPLWTYLKTSHTAHGEHLEADWLYRESPYEMLSVNSDEIDVFNEILTVRYYTALSTSYNEFLNAMRQLRYSPINEGANGAKGNSKVYQNGYIQYRISTVPANKEHSILYLIEIRSASPLLRKDS